MSNSLNQVIEEIKERNDIVEIISSYISLKAAGVNYKACCPFHSEKTASFVVSPNKQLFKCFGCGEGGDLIKFVMKIENLDFIETLKILADKSGIEWPQNDEYKENPQKKSIKEELYEIHIQSARFFFERLWKGKKDALDYLNDRGLKDKVMRSFGLGYSGDSKELTEFLLTQGFSKEILLKSGLVLEKNGDMIDRFRRRIMFPIFDYRGRVIAFGGRAMGNSMPKYLNSPDTDIFNKSNHLYGLNFARKYMQSNSLILVEGYMDVISLAQAGIKNCVASLGTALTSNQAKLISKYVKKAYISYDSDNAGITATERALEILSEQKLKSAIIDLEEFKDPDEFIKSRGLEGFMDKISTAQTPLDFTLNLLKKKYNLSELREQAEFVKEVASILKKVKSSVEVEFQIKRLSNETKIHIKTFGTEVYGKYFSPKQFENETKRTIEESEYHVIQKGTMLAEKQLLKLFLEKKRMRQIILMKMDLEDFYIDEVKEAIQKLMEINLDVKRIDFKKEGINIREDFFEDMGDFSVEEFKEENLDNLIKAVKRNTIKETIQKKTDEMKMLAAAKVDKNSEASEVDEKLVELGTSIVKLNKKLKEI